MIEVRNISKKFGSFTALQDVSFSLSRGEVVGFLGPNGAGKTTTLRILTGFLPATSGSCTIDGMDVARDRIAVRRRLGYLPESNPLYPEMAVLDYLKYIGSLRGLAENSLKEALARVIDSCGLTGVLTQKIATLSKGFKQRTGLAQALIHNPQVLILDEPTVGLDPNQVAEIRNLIREIGKEHTVLLSSHYLAEIEQTCGRVIIISRGILCAQGTPAELMQQTREATLENVFLKLTRAKE